MASSLELNKLLAGVLTAGIIAVGAGVVAGILYRPHPLPEHAFSVAVPEDASATADAADTPEEPSIAELLADADPSAGETITRQCTTCHVFDEGGENRVGPALWGVVGRDIASAAGFSYSSALSALEGEWSYEALDGFLTAPRDWAPGTSMSYAGLRSATDRANLIAYLRQQSSDPLPLPEAAPAEEPEVAAEEAAPAEEPEVAADEAAPTEEPEVAADEAAPAEEPEAAADEAAPAEEPEVAAEEAAPAEEPEVAADEAAPAEEPEVAADEAAPAEEPEAAADEAAPTEEPEAAADEAAPAEEPEVAAEEAAPAEEPEVAAEEAAPAEEPAAAGGGESSPVVAMVADADPANGEAKFRQCASCHTADQGGQNRVGPNLWGVFGADIGTHEGFNYSEAITGLEGIWTVDKLNSYLENPRAYAPGNRMAFAGLRSEEDRAAVIAYLHSLSEDPKPLDIQ